MTVQTWLSLLGGGRRIGGGADFNGARWQVIDCVLAPVLSAHRIAADLVDDDSVGEGLVVRLDVKRPLLSVQRVFLAEVDVVDTCDLQTRREDTSALPLTHYYCDRDDSSYVGCSSTDLNANLPFSEGAARLRPGHSGARSYEKSRPHSSPRPPRRSPQTWE